MVGFARNCPIFIICFLVAATAQAQVVGELVAAESGVQPGSRTTVALEPIKIHTEAE